MCRYIGAQLPGSQEGSSSQQQLAPSCEFLCNHKSYSPGGVVPRSRVSQQWWAVQAPAKLGTRTCSQNPRQWWWRQWQWSVPASGTQVQIPQQWSLTSLAGPGCFSDVFSGCTLHPSLRRLSSYSQSQYCPGIWTPKPEPQYSALTHVNR